MDKKVLLDIFNNGIYYNPAHMHYSNDENVCVTCDMCSTNNLKVAIGWKTYDLCLLCANELSNNSEVKCEKIVDKKIIIPVKQQHIDPIFLMNQ